MIKHKNIIFIVLVIICSLQAYIIYQQGYKTNEITSVLADNSPNPVINSQNNAWLDPFINKSMAFSGNDPFADIERMHQQMQDFMNQRFNQHFNPNFNPGQNNWMGSFFNGQQPFAQDISMEKLDKGDHYLIIFHIPNMKDNQLNVELNEQQISLRGQFSKVIENKNQFGDIVSRSQSHQSVSRVISLPPGADYQNAKIENKKDRIEVILPKI